MKKYEAAQIVELGSADVLVLGLEGIEPDFPETPPPNVFYPGYADVDRDE